MDPSELDQEAAYVNKQHEPTVQPPKPPRRPPLLWCSVKIMHVYTAVLLPTVTCSHTIPCCAALCRAVLCQTVGEGGEIPPGNAPGETKWQSRVVRPKADIKLTAGKAINVPIETLIDQVVKSNKVCEVLGVKGVRLLGEG